MYSTNIFYWLCHSGWTFPKPPIIVMSTGVVNHLSWNIVILNPINNSISGMWLQIIWWIGQFWVILWLVLAKGFYRLQQVWWYIEVLNHNNNIKRTRLCITGANASVSQFYIILNLYLYKYSHILVSSNLPAADISGIYMIKSQQSVSNNKKTPATEYSILCLCIYTIPLHNLYLHKHKKSHLL